jgi:hypothetical protein
MTSEEKLKLIDQYNMGSAEFDYTLQLNKELLLYRPFEDAWTINENIIHCLDFEVANFHRYRWAIVAPNTRVLSFDGNAWKTGLNYQGADIAAAINIIKAVRYFISSHLKQIASADWTKYSYTFSEDKSFNLEVALKHWVDHVGFHRELIDRNIKLFSAKK